MHVLNAGYHPMAEHPLLKPVAQDKRFFLPDGSSITSLRDLAKRLPSLPESLYKNHVTATKNDFYNWVTHVVKDTHLSKEMKDLKDQSKLAKLISKRVAELEARDARREISSAVATQQNQKNSPHSFNDLPLVRPAAIPSRSELSAPHSPPPSKLQQSEIQQSDSQLQTRNTQPVYSKPQNGSFSSPGFKPLNTPKRDRPNTPPISIQKLQKPGDDNPSVSIIQSSNKQIQKQPSGSGDLIRKKSGTKPPSSFGFGEDYIPSPSKPVAIDLSKESSKHNGESDHNDVPQPPAAYYTNQESPARSFWPKPADCDHAKHLGCMRCGMLEFGIGLTIGIITTLMFAKAFF